MKEFFVSVIIPNYNHARFLDKRISSVLNQTYQRFEVIILDDNSTDESRKLIEGYSKSPKISQVSFNEKNSSSPFRQWEKGIEKAKGEIIWIAESDDFADEYFLEKLIQHFNNPGVGIVHCASYLVDENDKVQGEISSLQRNWVKKDENYFKSGRIKIQEDLRFSCTVLNASSVLFRKHFAKNALVGLKDYRFVGDWFFWISILSESDFYYSKELLNNFRISKNSYTGKKRPLEEEREKQLEILKTIQFSSSLIGAENTYTNKHFWIIRRWVRKAYFHFYNFKYWIPPLPLVFIPLFYIFFIPELVFALSEKTYQRVKSKSVRDNNC